MRVLHVSSYLPHRHHIWGGAEVACQSILNLLQEDGEHLCAAAISKPDQQLQTEIQLFTIDTLPDRLPTKNFHTMRHYWLQKDPVVMQQLGEVLDTWSPDLAHFHNFNILTFSALQAVVKRRIPRILSIYDYWLFCPTNMLVDQQTELCAKGHGAHCLFRCLKQHRQTKTEFFQQLPLLIRKPFFQKNLRQFNRIITLSQNSKQVMERYSTEPLTIDVIPLPSKVTVRPETAQHSEKPVIMFAGWVQARKGPDVVVKAMPEIIHKVPDAHLYLVGALSESHYESYIRGLIKELQLEAHVTVTGKLPQAEFEKRFLQAQVIAIAEQWENMSPVFLLEAMAARKAVVAGKIGGIPEYIRHGQDGMLVEYNKPQDYATKIIQLLRDSQFRKKLEASAAARVSELCQAEESLQKLKQCYAKASKEMIVI